MMTPALMAIRPATRGQQPERLAARARASRAHADREEEHAEQQALERLDGGLDRLAELGLGQQQAGDEGAERHGKPGHRPRPRRCRRSRTGWRPRTAPVARFDATRRNKGRSSSRPTMTMRPIASARMGQRQGRCPRAASRPCARPGWTRTAASARRPGPAPAGRQSSPGRRRSSAGAGRTAPR